MFPKKSQQQGIGHARLLDSLGIVGSKESEEVLEGAVEDVVFRSDDGKFAVIRLAADQEGAIASPKTAVGDLG
ncbi:MAG: hypothetical protein WBN01_03095, partial [Polyangiales bacterium]